MRLENYRTLWGLIDVTDGASARAPYSLLEEAVPDLKRLGYDGIELPFKVALYHGLDKVNALLKKYSMKCTVMIFSDGPAVPGDRLGVFGGPYQGYSAPSKPGETDKEKLVETHLRVWKEQVVGAQALNPTLIVSHSMKDYFTNDMACKFFTQALRFEKENGYLVCHETHRKRYLHSPWVARDILPRFPDLKLCADLSHWVNVAETDCNDFDLTQVIEDIAPMVWHIHCRVGYDHGPQVPDPRAPEWLPYTEGHERWWDAIWKAQAARGQNVSTMIAEHGPPNYQVTIPHTREPVALIHDVNHWLQLRRQDRFLKVLGQDGHETSRLVPSETQGYLPETNPGDSILLGRPRKGVLPDSGQRISML